MLPPKRNRNHGQRHYLSPQTYKTDYVIHFVFKIQTILCCYYDLWSWVEDCVDGGQTERFRESRSGNVAVIQEEGESSDREFWKRATQDPVNLKVKKWGLGEEYALCMKTKLNLGILILPQLEGTRAIAGVPIISRQTDDIFLKSRTSRTRNADRNLMMMAAVGKNSISPRLERGQRGSNAPQQCDLRSIEICIVIAVRNNGTILP